jgi:hypothetical protein
MKNDFLLILIAIVFTSCGYVHHVVLSKGSPGNGYFIYTYGENNLRPPDTFEIHGFVVNVNSYQHGKYQDYFTLQQFDSVKSTTINK